MNRRSYAPSPDCHGSAPQEDSLIAPPQVFSGWGRPLLVNLGYAASLVLLSLMSSPPAVPILSQKDWLAHGLAYGIQVFLLHELFRRRIGSTSAIVAAAATGLVFGAVVEALQLLQPARFFEVSDVLANAVGVAAAAALLAIATGRQAGSKTERSL